MVYVSSDNYYKVANSKKADAAPSPKAELDKLQTPKVAIAINTQDPATKANLLKVLESGFSIESAKGKPVRIVSGDVSIQVTVDKKHKAIFDKILSDTSEHYDLGQKRYAAGFLLRELDKLGSATLKSKTIFESHVEKPIKPSSNDKLAGVLASGEVTLDLAKSLKSGKVELSVNGSHLSVSVAGKPKDDPVYPVLSRAILNCLEKHKDASPVERATALTMLLDNFSFKGESLKINTTTADASLVNAAPVKVSFPENLEEALKITAGHLLKSKAGEIQVSVEQNAGVWSLNVENSTSKLAIDIDAKLLVAKDPKSTLESIANEIKEKAGSLLNTQQGISQLTEFISDKLKKIPKSKLSETASVVEVAVQDQSAYYDLNDGKITKKPDHKSANSSYKAVSRKWAELDGQPAVAEENTVDLKASSLGENAAAVVASAKAELDAEEAETPFTIVPPVPDNGIPNNPFAPLEESELKEATPTGDAKIVSAVDTAEPPAKTEETAAPVAVPAASRRSGLRDWWNGTKLSRRIASLLPAKAAQNSEVSDKA